MKITDQLPVDVPAQGTRGPAKAGARDAKGAPAPDSTTTASDRVDISPALRRLEGLASEVDASGEIDATRVADLRAAIAEGRYAPSDTDVATALLGDLAVQALG